MPCMGSKRRREFCKNLPSVSFSKFSSVESKVILRKRAQAIQNLYIHSLFLSPQNMEPKREDVDRGIFSNSNNTPYRKDISSPALPPTIFHKKVFNRKGQVTIFIIVGIIILAAAAAIFFISSSTVRERLTTEGEPVIAQVPVEFAPLKDFTDNCLLDVSKRGLLILGEQGGYIYPELVGQYSAGNPTDADGIDLEPLKVPYWHYNKEPNAGNKISFASLQPKLYASEDKEMSIEAQLGRFVNEKLEGCLQGYQPFKEQGYAVEVLSLPSATARVTDNFVQFSLQLDVDASRGNAQHSFEEFFVKVPLKLKEYYEVAERIVKAEQNYSFLERQGMDLIQIFSGVDAEKLPPTSAVTFEFVPTVSWNSVNVKQDIQNILSSYVSMLRFLGSSNFYRYEYPTSDLTGLYQRSYDNMILPLEEADELEISFDYFGWPLYFDVNSKGETVQPQSLAIDFSLLHFGTQRYYTVYDVSYPVLVSLRDSRAFDGSGFTFAFALESNLRNNAPAESQEILPTTAVALAGTMVCDKDKYDSELVKTIVVDSSTGKPLETVQIGFSIPEQGDCALGLTDDRGVFESKYPAVYGGVVSIIKEDYLTNFYPIDTYKFKDQSGIIGYAMKGYSEKVFPLHKFKPLSISVKKKNLEKCVGAVCYFSSSLFEGSGEGVYSYTPKLLDSKHRWIFTDVVRPLKSSEQAIVTLNRVSDVYPDIFNDEFSASVTITGDTTQNIELVPGIYKVSAQLILKEEVVIPKEERCGGGFIGIGEDCFTINENRMPSFPSGQLEWNDKPTYLVITPEQLYGSSSLELYLPAINIKKVPPKEHIRVVEDLQVMGELGKISRLPMVREALEPAFR